jgi:hypothetical protein
MSDPASSLSASPMTFSQILDRTYRITRANLRTFLAIALVPCLVSIALVVALEALFFVPLIRQFPNPPSQESLSQLSLIMRPAIFAPAFLLITILSATIFALYFAAALHAATRADRGVPTSFSEAWRAAWTRAGRYIGLTLLLYVITILPLFVIELLIVGGASLLPVGKTAPNPALFLFIPLVMLLFLASFVYAILMGLRLSLAFPACVVEGLSARASLKRSSHLTQNAKGRIFLVLLVEYAILYALIMVVEFVIMILAGIGFFIWSALQIHLTPPWSYVAISCGILFLVLLISLCTALTWAGLTSSLAVLYRDQCLRKDFPPPMPQPSGAPA